jgi:hypothetical protein
MGIDKLNKFALLSLKCIHGAQCRKAHFNMTSRRGKRDTALAIRIHRLGAADLAYNEISFLGQGHVESQGQRCCDDGPRKLSLGCIV